MNDPISEMSESELIYQCEEILGDCLTPMQLIGLIIIKLQEWGCGINYPFNEKKWFSYHAGFMKSIEDVSLLVMFLKTAQALGHWSPPKKVEERTLEERVFRLEAFVKSKYEQFPDLR